jgi:bla regulator protein blaR1
MFTYLIQTSTCLIILYGIYHFILSEMTFFKYNRAYLLISIVASLMIPILAPLLVLTDESVPVLHWSHIAQDITFVAFENEEASFDWKNLVVNLLWVAYFLGVFVVILKTIYGLTKIYRYYQQGQKETFNGYEIITTEAVHLPFSFFNGIYVSRHVPLQDHIHTILEHEEIHIRQWHTVDVLMAEMVHAFFWFNPVMIFYKRALRQAHEFLADDLICRKNSVSSYTELLLSKSQSGLELALTNQFFHSQIKKRIKMMTKNKSNVLNLWKYALAVPMIGILLITFSCKEVENPSSVIENNANATIAIQKKVDPDYTDLEKQNILVRAEEMPRFPGCEEIADLKERNTCSEQKLLQYIYSNLKYPEEARLADIAGQCVAKFIVNTEGKIQDIRILRDAGGGCGESVKQVILSMNTMPQLWIPGKQSGKAVNVVYTLPVKFAISE